MHRAGLLSLALASAVSCLQPDIRADSNRDGLVDLDGLSDTLNKALWTPQHGAIFLPNIGDKHHRCTITDSIGNPWSNDELAACHDASGDLLLAPEYVAPLRTLPLNVSDQATARIYATPQAAYDRVRLFVLDDPDNINSTQSWRLVDQEFSFNSTQLRDGITLGIDGRELVTDASIWDGSVLVKFDVTEANGIQASDAVALHMAPVLTHHHLQTVETLISTSPRTSDSAAHSTDPIQNNFITQLDTARAQANITTPLLLFNTSSDIWAQDFIEPAYASMPGAHGPISIRVILRSAQSTRTAGRQVFTQLRGPGVGGFQPLTGPSRSGLGHREVNSFGNLETIPSYVSKRGVPYPAGRIIMGRHYGELPAQSMLDFLHAQRLQTPLILETGWLLIGHVDEFVQFLPFGNELGFTVGIADTRPALQLLRTLERGGHGNISAISFEAETDEPGENLTITQLLSNTTFLNANAYAQRHIDANLQVLLSEIPLAETDVLRIPTLFRDFDAEGSAISALTQPGPDGLPPHTPPPMSGERLMMAFYPAAVNGIVLGDRYLAPKPWGPVINGRDVLESAVEEVYGKAGMSVRFINDYLSHHVGAGEIHCGSNTLRQMDGVWWE
ncbi:hypothetical protein BDW74DRAFT_173746 [Aspergillus multicolor]|uniref:protein-arginine deiminase domain-containing protein n=1 Tax=Aspergillus multicolor TaxID=41759 RepID=UPI003CCD36A1